MAVSTSDLIQRVRDALNERPYVTTATATSGSDTGIDVEDGGDWDAGAILEFQDNGEQCLVKSVSGNVCTVIRGWNGTSALSVTHTSQQAYRDPNFTYISIKRALDQAVRRLWPYAYKVLSDTITPAPTNTAWYDLPTDFIDAISFDQVYGSLGQHIGRFGQRGTGRPVVWAENLPTAVVASGKGAKFPYGFFDNTEDVIVTYRAAITGTSDIEDSGELNTADAVVLGALAYLFTGLEGERVGVGEDAEQSRSIRTGSRLTVGRTYEQDFRTALQMLKLAHEAQYPPLRRVG